MAHYNPESPSPALQKRDKTPKVLNGGSNSKELLSTFVIYKQLFASGSLNDIEPRYFLKGNFAITRNFVNDQFHIFDTDAI